jgi:hypothetical protein
MTSANRKRKWPLDLLLGMLALISAAPTNAQDDVAPAEDLIHSDLPLYGDETDDKWPRSFANAEGGEFGCVSRVSFGDWRLRRSGEDDEDSDSWYRIRNYGAFHCFALVANAYGRKDLPRTDSRSSFFVLLGQARGVELWVLQMGGRPGSDYLLLARKPGEGMVASFDVLQQDCPKRNRRKGNSIDILRTDYCSINSKSELVRLAQRMARLKPLGTLTREADVPEDDADAKE